MCQVLYCQAPLTCMLRVDGAFLILPALSR
nr:MAG TPA: hypothetical protein [Caudoviricetes sp.]